MRDQAIAFGWRWLAVAAFTVLCCFGSEAVYYGDHKPFPEYMAPTMLYWTMAFWPLFLVRRFGLGTVWALGLAGGLYGWLTETIFAQEALSGHWFDAIYTPWGWHVAVTMLMCWFGAGSALVAKKPWHLAGWSALLGVTWGFTNASWVAADTTLTQHAPLTYAGYAFGFAAFWIVSLGVWAWAGRRITQFSKWEVGAMLVWTLYCAVAMQIFTVGPVGMVVTAVVVGLLLWLIRRSPSEKPDLIERTTGPFELKHLALTLVAPTVAVGVYNIPGLVAGIEDMGLSALTGIGIGMTLLIGGVIRALWRNGPARNANPAASVN